MQLWEVKGFESSSVKALFIGKTANGQDCIGCAWDANTLYVYAYEGIVDTFLYFSPYASGRKQQNHNQRYTLRRYETMTNHLVVHQNVCFDTPENAIKNLISSGDLEVERSYFVDCMAKRFA